MNQKLTKYLSIILYSILLAGCATNYKPESFNGGYSEMALSKDVYNVTFRGNGSTSEDKVYNYMLRRSAELTLDKGYKYFTIIKEETKATISFRETPTTVSTQKNSNTNKNSSAHAHNTHRSKNSNAASTSTSITTVSPGTKYKVAKYATTAKIKMRNEESNSIRTYNAEIILGNFLEKA